MSDPTTIVRRYIDMWNETDPGRRRQLVAEALTDDASYLDPIMAGNGTDEISAMIGAAQAQYPGHRFELVAGPDVHHDRVRRRADRRGDASTDNWIRVKEGLERDALCLRQSRSGNMIWKYAPYKR